MKAEDIIKKHIPNGCINLKGITKEREAILVCMKDYARIQIEKHIESIRENPVYTDGSIDLESTLNNTPINLD